MLESKILETRLINKESSFVGSSVSKCATRFQQLLTNKKQLLELSRNPESTTNNLDSIEKKSKELNLSLEHYIREIVQYKLDIHRVSSTQKAYFHQIQCYNDLENEIRSKILKTEYDISEYEVNFGNEKLIRLHREHLEVKASEVNKLPSKNILKRKLHEMETNIINLEKNIEMANSKVSARYKQFQSLLDCLDQLNDNLPLIEDNDGSTNGNDSGVIQSRSHDGGTLDEEEEVRERDNDRETRQIVLESYEDENNRSPSVVEAADDDINESVLLVSTEMIL